MYSESPRGSPKKSRTRSTSSRPSRARAIRRSSSAIPVLRASRALRISSSSCRTTSSVRSLRSWILFWRSEISEFSLDSRARVEEASSSMSIPAAISVWRTMRTALERGTSGGRLRMISAAR